MFEKILIPTDLSEPSEYACRFAMDIAKKFRSRVYVLHVIDEGIVDAFSLGGLSFEHYRDTVRRRASRTLDAFVEDNIKEFENFDVLLKFGNPFEEIVKSARDIPASLVIMCSHGRTGVDRVVFGSVTEKVVRHAPCPVLVIPKM